MTSAGEPLNGFDLDVIGTLQGCIRADSERDLLLSAVGSCLAVAWVGALTTRGIAIRSLEIDVAGRVNFAGAYLLDGTPSGFASIEIDVRLDADADAAVVEDLSDEVLRMSIIPDTIARPVPVSVRLASDAAPRP